MNRVRTWIDIWYDLSIGQGTLDSIHEMSGSCKGRVHLTAVARELDLVVVQEVRWYKGGMVKVRNYNIL
jgi:hypothetical protein